MTQLDIYVYLKNQLNYLVQDLKEHNMLPSTTIFSCYRNWDKHLRNYFSVENKFVYCNDIKCSRQWEYHITLWTGDCLLIHQQKV